MSSQGEYYGVQPSGTGWVAMYDSEQQLVGEWFATKEEAEEFVRQDQVSDMIKNSSKPSDGHSESPSSRPMTLRQQLEQLMHAQRVNDSMFDEGSEEWETNRVTLIDQYEALCQEIAREARLDEQDKLTVQILNNSGRSDFLYLISKFNSVRVKDIKSELTQKPPQPPQGGLEEVSDEK